MRNYQIFIHIPNDFPSRKKSKKERSEMFSLCLHGSYLPSKFATTFPSSFFRIYYILSQISFRIHKIISIHILKIFIHIPHNFPSRKKSKEERSDDVFTLSPCKTHQRIPSLFFILLPSKATTYLQKFSFISSTIFLQEINSRKSEARCFPYP